MIKKISPLVLVIVLLAVPAVAQETLEITFNEVPATACDEVWTQSGVAIQVTTTTSEDCDGGGNCSFIEWDENGGVGMAPARLSLDLGESYLIYSVEIDIQDFCGSGCTRAFLYNGGVQVGSTANTTVGAVETLVVAPAGNFADSIAVSSCEGVVLGQTIRIFSEVVATEPQTWGAIKGAYR
jgi:hypothetical protein